MNDQEWEELFDRYITEVIDDEQEHIKSHELPTAIKIRSLVSDSVTQAAANKAAEEGELPAEDDSLHSLILEVLSKHRMVRMFEVEEFGLGNSYPLIDRLCLDDGADVESGQVEVDALAWAIADKLAADRASRQVANKAEQETRAAYRDRPTYDEKVSIGSRDFFEMLIEYGKEPSLSKRMEIADFIDSHIDNLVANKAEVDPACVCGSPTTLGSVHRTDGPCYVAEATPPATTGASTVRDQALEEAAALVEGCDKRASLRGISIAIRALKGSVGASTVLTDERIENLWHEACLNHVDLDDSAIPEFARAIAREVAAQAGQVAVLEWEPIETAPKTGRTLLLGCFNEMGNWRTMRGQWFTKADIDQDWEETDGFEAGWYETAVEPDFPNCWEISPTHWMELPAAPSPAKESK